MKRICIKRLNDGTADVYTPYSSEFVSTLHKKIGSARWDGDEGAWNIRQGDIPAVRSIMKDIYHETDLPEERLITISVTFLKEWREENRIWLFGREIAFAPEWSHNVRLGSDVTVVKGCLTSIHYDRYDPDAVISEGTVLLVHDVPESTLKEWKDSTELKVEEAENQSPDRESLLEEKELFLERIAEIDAILKQEDSRPAEKGS